MCVCVCVCVCVSEAAIVRLVFQVRYTSSSDEKLLLLGGIPELGNWRESRAIPLNLEPSYTNLFRCGTAWGWTWCW